MPEQINEEMWAKAGTAGHVSQETIKRYIEEAQDL